MSRSEDQKSEDKEHAPSEKKLMDARRQGDVPKSTELIAAAAYGGLFLAGVAGLQGVDTAATAGKALIAQAPELAALAASSGRSVFGAVLHNAISPLILLLLVPACAAILAIFAQRAFVFVPQKLSPKLSRISPWSNAKSKFGREGLVEFLKTVVKLCIVSVALGLFLMKHLNGILATASLDPRQSLVYLFWLLGTFLAIVILITLVIGATDLLWQRHAHAQRNRMSREEMMDEIKENEGDLNTKSQRRQRAQDIAMNQMSAEVAKASVVIVNPTHYAVALHWARGTRTAPVVVAKGADAMARRIREVAVAHGVPLHSDPATARSLFATVEVGRPIPRDHYRAVAAAIRFAETMRKRAKERQI